jgi:CubicO group peptidase (beta-lactamase class C family)
MSKPWFRVAGQALLAAFLSVTVTAADLRSGAPQRSGFSPERLQRIDNFMNQAVADGVMVGGQGMIARGNRVVYQRTWGLSDRETAKPMTEDAIFRIYSMSKPITAVALMMLYEDGRFSLNDPVADYLPEFSELRVALSTADSTAGVTSDGTLSVGAGADDSELRGQTRDPVRPPTIRDLLLHTAGMTYGIFGETEVDALYRENALFEQRDLASFSRTLGALPLQYDPGSRWHYSVSVDVQGRLVEVLSGMRFGEFLEKRIFAPLGMEDTAFRVPKEKENRLATLYSPGGTVAGSNVIWQRSNSKELVPTDLSASRSFHDGDLFESGGGGLVSTAADYMRFCLMILNGGELDGVRLLSPMTVDLMTANHLGEMRVGDQPGLGFGLGFAVVLDPGLMGELGSAGEVNWGGAAGTRFWIDREEQVVGIFMVQSIPHQTPLGRRFKTLTYQALVD